jgi:hypothetical protein
MIHSKPEAIIRNVYALYPALALQAGIKLDIFSRLHGNPMTAEVLAKSLNVKEVKLSPLLYALAGAGLLDLEGDMFSNTPETDRYLVHGSMDYKAHICFLIDKIINVVSKTAETIKNGMPCLQIDWAERTVDEQSDAMNGQYFGSLQAGRELADKVDLSSSRQILDVAGGSGGLAIGLCQCCQEACITIAELPGVVPATRTFISKAGMTHRINVVGTDITQQPPEGRYDTAIVRSFLQVLSPEHAGKTLKSLREALLPDGMIYILGHFLDDTRLFPHESVLHNLMFINLYEEGQAYTAKNYRSWLEKANFGDIRIEYAVFSGGMGMISARRM